MAQGSQNFTPAQILEAGRRAEAEGRIEYAIQFYRHLTDHLTRTAEAVTAREALQRLGAVAGSSQAPNGGAVNGHHHIGTARAGQAPPSPQKAGSQPFASATPVTQPPGRQHPADHGGTGALIVRSGPASAGRPEAGSKRHLVLPRPRRRYRTGRFVARAFTVFGFLEIAAGATFVIAGLVGRSGIAGAALPEFLASLQLLGATAGIGLAAVGLIQVLGGQLARAIFDIASSNRDLVAYTRARAAFEAGIVDDEPPQQD